jgi:N-acetylglucosamine-6-phosphate deacetylase
MLALTGARVFDGAHLLEGRTVLIEGDRIAGLVADRDIPTGARRRRMSGLIAPGFIDIQVNGGGGVLFNADRSVEAIAAIGAAHRKFGTTGFLPTLITSPREHMAEAIAAVEAAIEAGVPGVLGIHLEGPFLNPERKGAHDPSLMRPVEESDLRLITSPRKGRTLMTLAPEQVPLRAISRLAKAGVVIAAGHTAASPSVIAAARAKGLTGYTHLFNAMPPVSSREPGPAGAAMADPDAWCSIIADLVHVDAVNLRFALAARGWERTILISDAMPTVGSSIREFTLGGKTVLRKKDRLVMEDGTLAGAHFDMATAVRNTVAKLGMPLEAALHMASRTPAEFMRFPHILGRIAADFRADLVVLDDDLRVTETFIGGVSDAA